MPHIIRKPGILGGTTLAVFMTLVHTVNDAMTAILGALLPTLQVKFDAGPTALALMIAVFWVASSVTQPVFGALGEDVGLRVIGCAGVLMASTFLSLIGIASELWVVLLLLVIGGLGSAALHPIGTTIAGSQATNATLGIGLFTAGGMVGFALGPVVILRIVSAYGLDATVWLAIPGVILGVAVGVLLPQWERHPRRPLRRLFDLRLVRGPVGALAVASMFSALAFITFTGSIPLWLVHESGYSPDAAVIGWTLSAFAFAGGLGSIVGGFLAPRLGPVLTIVGAFLLTLGPLLAVIAIEPGTVRYFGAIVFAGILIFVPIPARRTRSRSSSATT
jgi:MFS transporter, FSR family, fosmidomycin resistance protein